MAQGRLRVYLGAAPGVGKTYRMLEEGHRRRERGTDVVVGYAETHDRKHTEAMLLGLEVQPRIDVHLVTHEEVNQGRGRAVAVNALSRSRRALGFGLAVLGLTALTVVLGLLRAQLSLSSDIFAVPGRGGPDANRLAVCRQLLTEPGMAYRFQP